MNEIKNSYWIGNPGSLSVESQKTQLQDQHVINTAVTLVKQLQEGVITTEYYRQQMAALKTTGKTDDSVKVLPNNLDEENYRLPEGSYNKVLDDLGAYHNTSNIRLFTLPNVRSTNVLIDYILTEVVKNKGFTADYIDVCLKKLAGEIESEEFKFPGMGKVSKAEIIQALKKT